MNVSRTLLAAWARTVRREPAAVALVDASSGRRWTRREIDALATHWCATHGGNLGGQAVIFSEPNGAGWLTLYLGLLKANAVAVPLDAGEPLAAQQSIATSINAPFRWTAGGLEQGGPRRPAPRDGRSIIRCQDFQCLPSVGNRRDGKSFPLQQAFERRARCLMVFRDQNALG